MTAAVLETDRLHYSYPDGTAALTDVSVRIERGEVVAVLGPSGAGKSTLFRCIAGLEHATSGVVRLDGADISGLRGDDRRRMLARIGLVFQEFHLVGQATVLSNVLIGRLAKANPWLTLLHLLPLRDRKAAVDLVVRVGLEPQLRKRADALSGGQRQRVALARALAQEPEVLLADEPVANLDPVLAAGVVDDIVALVREEHLTAVLNLHDVDLARRVAQRVIGMRQGRKLFDLPVDEVTDETLAGLYRGAGDPAADPAAASAEKATSADEPTPVVIPEAAL